ncbi:hypothetical protein HPB52_014443 [Rhipicephalus sanguineus]|uniref:Uncharacterized protein n=1 Tax=Rhipicephalus sanguineus TaxID=34632 RepID=A0A9D4PBU2_RHISA|nr:hypothetical protein HPB52_014443 [Rhipicephalus sanguineus]
MATEDCWLAKQHHAHLREVKKCQIMSSNYFKKLEAEAQRRYRAKLSFGGDELPDPFDDDVVRFGFSSGLEICPPEQFKCHKIGDAYNMFLSGKVKQLKSFKAGKRGNDGDGVVLVAATVEASQTLSKQYQAWCVVKEVGTVESAHCTCMAG